MCELRIAAWNILTHGTQQKTFKERKVYMGSKSAFQSMTGYFHFCEPTAGMNNMAGRMADMEEKDGNKIHISHHMLPMTYFLQLNFLPPLKTFLSNDDSNYAERLKKAEPSWSIHLCDDPWERPSLHTGSRQSLHAQTLTLILTYIWQFLFSFSF